MFPSRRNPPPTTHQNGSSTIKPARQAVSPGPPQTHWMRNCLVTRSLCDGREVAKNLLEPSVQLLSHVQLCKPINCSMPDLPVHHQLPEFTQTHIHRVGDAIQPSHSLSSPSPPAIRVFSNESTLRMRWLEPYVVSILDSLPHPSPLEYKRHNWTNNTK